VRSTTDDTKHRRQPARDISAHDNILLICDPCGILFYQQCGEETNSRHSGESRNPLNDDEVAGLTHNDGKNIFFI
jgi:hypothetical protein